MSSNASPCPSPTPNSSTRGKKSCPSPCPNDLQKLKLSQMTKESLEIKCFQLLKENSELKESQSQAYRERNRLNMEILQLKNELSENGDKEGQLKKQIEVLELRLGYKSKSKAEIVNRPCSGNLQKHLDTHTGKQSFKCPKCSKTFATKAYLQMHLKRHTKTKPFKCIQCGLDFKYKANLARHSSDKH